MNNSNTKRLRNNIIIFLVAAGLLLIALAFAADYLGIDLTPGFGVIQTVTFLGGLTLLTLGAYLYLHSKRPQEAPRSLQAEIATRLIATGLVLSYVTGLSDLIGIGTHVGPAFNRPFIGPLQFGGILIGVLLILFGLILYHTSRGQRESSSLEFLVTKKENGRPEKKTVEILPRSYRRLFNWNGWFSTVNTAVSDDIGR